MRSFKVSARDWLRYADSVGDSNPIHRTDAAAIKYGLPRRIAPGMYLASQVQGREGISDIRSIKFSGNVFDGDEISISDSSGMRGSEYIFRRGDDVVCEVKGVRFGRPHGESKPLADVIHVYKTEITPARTALYLEAIGQQGLVTVPDMYLVSLAAPALLDLGAQNGLTGVHVSQTFNSHAEYRPGPVDILIGDRKDKGPLSFLELRAVQDDKTIASSKAGVLRIEE